MLQWETTLRKGHNGPTKHSNIGSEEIWQFREQLAAARTEAQTYQEEMVSAQETVTVLQSQLQTAKLEAKVDKLQVME